MSHIRKRHQNNPNTDEQNIQNELFKKIRISIEWDYGVTAQLFQYVDLKKNNRICAGGSNVSKTYLSAVLLKNCHICLYGSITATYFSCMPPTLES